VNPEDRSLFMQQVDGSSGLTPLEFQMRRRDGRIIWVENQGIAIRDDQGRIQYYQGTLKDVTERRKAEEELRLARFCLDHAAVAIFRVGDGARILDVNTEACRSLGYGRQELVGRTVFEIDPDFTPEKWADHRRILAQEGVRVVRSHHRRKDGSRFPVEITANFIEKDGRGFSYAFVTDISSRLKAERDREKLESQLQQAQKMEAIGVLAGGIAHDFNNILSVIIGNADMLMLSDGAPENDRFSVQQIQIAATRARQLVKQILTFSRRDEQQRMLINLKSVVQETYDFLKSTLPSSIRVERHIGVDAGSAILGNPTQMQQVLMNLCTNAAHAMEHQENGLLEIRIDKATISAEQAGFEPGVEPGEFLRLTVSDTGAGIAPEIQHRIFDPYFTTKEQGKGTGLGLSVVHGIVKSHDGFIMLESEAGKGSRFQIFLPLVAEGAPPEAPASPATLPGGSETLLVVDDEKALVDMTAQMLRRMGYTVETRTSPIEAIEAFSAGPGRYDAVITDMTMPQMNGVNLARTLLGIKPGLPILLCTGFSDQANEQKARAAGIREFAFKPLALGDLARTLRRMLDPGAGGQGTA
jgi:PAS domain S-box-containing protein